MANSVFHLSDGESVTVETHEEKANRETDQEAEKLLIDDFLKEIREDLRSNKIYLPTLPEISLEALLIINDAYSSHTDLEKVIAKDAALTARLIRYANSPLYRGREPVMTIKYGIIRIGFERVKNAVYAVSMKEVFRTPIKLIQQRMERLWSHSVKVAAQAAILAKSHPHLDPDIALVAGLVHDIGYIPLLIKVCNYADLLTNTDYLDRLLEKLHPQVGSAMAKLWEFDPAMISVVAEHENLARDPGDTPVDYVDLIQVANILSYEETDHRLALAERKSIKAFERVGLNRELQEDCDADITAKDIEDSIV